jgi:hypothetical protein
LYTLPICQKLNLPPLCPCQHVSRYADWQAPFRYLSWHDMNERHVFTIARMEVRRAMVVVEHDENDTIKGANPRHELVPPKAFAKTD